MNTNPVTKQQVIAADNDLSLINPVIKTLSDINRSRVKSVDFPYNEIRSFERMLKTLRDENLAIIDSGNQQYAARPEKLLIEIVARVEKIPGLVDLAHSDLKHKKLLIENKRGVLLRQGFSDEEINKVVPAVEQSDIDELHVKSDGLKAEREKLLLFLGDTPEYRTSLLDGTIFEQKAVDI